MTKSAAFHYVGAAFAAWGALYTGQWQWVGFALSNGINAEKQRTARNRARDAYNASLQDRMAMLDLRPDAPRTIALGRVRAVEGVRRRWVSGANNEKLTLIVSFVGHEIDGFEQFWFNDIPLTLDGSGYAIKPANLTGCSAAASGTTATLTKTAHGRANGEKVLISGFDVARFNGTFVVTNATVNTFDYVVANTGGTPSTASGIVEVLSPYVRSDNRTDTLTATADGSGNASVTLTSTPISGTIKAVYTSGTGDAMSQGECTVTLDTGLVYDISDAPPSATIDVSWQTATTDSSVRIRTYLGTSSQSVGTDLASEYPGKLTTTDHFKGIALAVIDLQYSDDAFPQGIPNITATFRGAKCLDPRTSTTAWTENPAIHAYHYARLENGWNVPDAEIRSQDFEDAADFCDTSTTFTLGDYDATLERYRCGIVLSTDADPRQNMNAIMATMAGRWGWAGGTLRMRCGRMSTPVWTLDESWIAQQVGNGGQTSDAPVVRITNGVPREEKVNHVSGTCVDPDQRYQALPYPTVRDDVLIAADGAEYRLDADMPGVNHIAHAQHLASIMIREGQAPLRMEVTSNLLAYPLELFDVGEVTVDRYGMVAKTFEVIGWRWRPTEGVMLRLSEITDDIFVPVDTLNGRDPAPNGNLPSPWNVEQIVGVAVDADAMLQSDGSVLTLSVVTWTAPTSQAVLVGGKIEVQYVRADSVPATGDWTSWIEQGDALSAIIPSLLADIYYLFRVRAINSLGVRGKWSDNVLHLVLSDVVPPEDVTGLDWEIKPSLVRITCDPCIASDYAETELRYMNTLPDYDSGDWAAATFLVSGKTNEYHHPRPDNGTYYVLAKHKDTSGNYSVDPAYITVVVDDSIDPGGVATGTLRLRASRIPYFFFADGTTHTAQAPGDETITFTATLLDLVGTATFTAEAFNAASGGTSLGTFTLGGSGNARTMTAAQFVSLGTSGSVERVVVTATIGTASDYIDVYRQDSTTTAPRIFLDNQLAPVNTDAAGEFGDYSDASTGVFVYAALSDVTSTYTFAITPDGGMTATINGGAGPVSGTGSVTVAVSDSTIDDGAVLITTSGPGVLTATFRVLKRKASSGYTAFFTPDEIRLPVDVNGAVSTYTGATSEFTIMQGALDDTAQWTLAKADTNVTSTLTGGTVDITNFYSLGDIGTPTSVTVTLASGWSRINTVIRGENEWIMLGYHASGTWQYIKRSTDFVTWTDVDIGLAAKWAIGTYEHTTGAYVLIEQGTGSTNKTRRSTDGGLTWSGAVTLPLSTQWNNIASGGGKIIATSATSATAAYSTNGGTSWSTYTYPASTLELHYGGSVWLSRDSSDVVRKSLDAGATWTTVSTLPLVVNAAVSFLGRTVITFKYSSTNKAAFSNDGGLTFQVVTLPYNYTNAAPVNIAGVLYLFGTKVMYTTDGTTWKSDGENSPSMVPITGEHQTYSYIPALDISVDKAWLVPLTSNSADTGYVTVTASKPNEADVVRALPVRKGTTTADVYTSQATPASMLLPSTSDGVVTSYTAGVVVAQINRNGADDTSNWTITWTTTNLTPSSGTGATVTLTAMTDGVLSGLITFTATKAGQPIITGQVGVFKSYGIESSGPRIGAAFNAITVTATYIGLKFLGDGQFQIKVGSGGTYTNAGQWAGAVRSSNASTYWIRVDVLSGTLTSGTTGSWLAMTSDREYTLSDATSGTHTVQLQVLIGTSSGGANAVLATGTLQLIVP